MNARPSHGPQHINGALWTERQDDGPHGDSPDGDLERHGAAKYPHIKDLQAKAEAEGKQQGPYTPVLSLHFFVAWRPTNEQ